VNNNSENNSKKRGKLDEVQVDPVLSVNTVMLYMLLNVRITRDVRSAMQFHRR
jgi:hypothetical protein